MALRLIQLPAGVISNATKQVYFQSASHSYNKGNNIRKKLVKSTIYLGIIGIVPTVLIIFFAPTIFELLLGSEWREAGIFSSWLILWLFLGFMNTPSLATIQIIGKQSFLLKYEIILMVVRVVTILLSSYFFNYMVTISAYSIVGAIFNVFLILMTIHFTKSQ